MGFEPITQKIKEFSRITTIHFAIVNTPAMRVGKVTIPPQLLSQLGWVPKANLDVAAGAGEDAGWYKLNPAADPDAKHRARLKVASNGVGRFTTKALVPDAITGPLNSYQPAFRLDGNSLFVKVL
jgi:hypothetical protein